MSISESKIDRANEIGNTLLERAEKWKWRVTALVFGHGKVILYAETPRGRHTQMTRRIDEPPDDPA